MKYRKGQFEDLSNLKKLGIKSWSVYKSDLTHENWLELQESLSNDEVYSELLMKSECFVCESETGAIIGMSFLVPKGNPTAIYHKDWCYIRFVSVDPDFCGMGIGKQLTEKCIEYARATKEKTIALHTSEIMHKAMHIYERLGFIICREIEPRLGKKYWLYKLEL